MPRVKRGTTHVAKRRRLLKKTKGYRWGRKKLIKQAKTAVIKAGAHAYVDRRKKKRNNRNLWHIKINAFVREHNLNYSTFMRLLKGSQIELDRKVLAVLAEKHGPVLQRIIEEVQAAK